MRAAAVQLTSTADFDHNLEQADTLTRAAARDGAQLVVLPEKWSALGRGAVQVAGAQPLDGPAISWARAAARELGIDLVAGSLTERVEGEERLRNTSVHIGPTGQIMASIGGTLTPEIARDIGLVVGIFEAGPQNAMFPALNTSGYTPTAPIATPGPVMHQGVLIEWTDTNPANNTFEGTARGDTILGGFESSSGFSTSTTNYYTAFIGEWLDGAAARAVPAGARHRLGRHRHRPALPADQGAAVAAGGGVSPVRARHLKGVPYEQPPYKKKPGAEGQRRGRSRETRATSSEGPCP